MSSHGVKNAASVNTSWRTSRRVCRASDATLVVLVALMVTKATWGVAGRRSVECKPCAISGCRNETSCRGGSTLDACGCCAKCLKVQGELCGGFAYRLGRCDHQLYCNITGAYRRDPIGRCAPVLTELQKKYTDRRGSARDTIPGPPASPKHIGFYVTRERATMEILRKLSPTTEDLEGYKGIGMALNGSSVISKDSIHHSTSTTAPAVTFLVVSGTLLLCIVLVGYVLERRSRSRRDRKGTMNGSDAAEENSDNLEYSPSRFLIKQAKSALQ